MANVNRAIRLLLIPLLIVGYIGYLALDRWQTDNNGVAQSFVAKLTDLQFAKTPFTGLILGGSNAYYSLSAELMSNLTNGNFYNFALSNEGFTLAGYQDEITRIAGDPARRDRVLTVIYSSVMPFRLGSIDPYTNPLNPADVGSGKPKFWSIEPTESLIQVIRRFFSPARGALETQYPLPTTAGDVNFATTACTDEVPQAPPNLEALEIVVSFYQRQAEFLSHTFPKAQIFMVVPSEFMADDGSYGQWSKRLTTLWHDRVGGKSRLLIQPPFPVAAYLCSQSHHANALGRVWRTIDLWGRMNL